MARKMKTKGFLFYLLLFNVQCSMFNSCTNHPDQVRITGDFANLEQAEFYIYSPSGAIDRLDTIKIQEGEFEYMAHIDGEAIFRLMYPNFSELTIFAKPGDEIEIEGDAQNLNAVDVDGSDDNEIYTEFREDITDLPLDKVRDVARDVALKYPRLAVSRYLFQEYFLQADSLQPKLVWEVYDSLCRANPDNIELNKLSRQVKAYGLLHDGAVIPDFKLKTRTSAFSGEEGRQITAKEFKGTYLLIAFWGSWKSGSQSALYRVRRFRREMKGKDLEVNAISYSLDSDERELRRIEKSDSIDFHSFCDFMCFNSPLVQQWGITDLPFFVLIGPDQKIIASGTDWQRDLEPKVSKVCL
jgi:hypothetical protein